MKNRIFTAVFAALVLSISAIAQEAGTTQTAEEMKVVVAESDSSTTEIPSSAIANVIKNSTNETLDNTPVPSSAEVVPSWLSRLGSIVDTIDGWVWGLPLIGSILVVGILLTICLRFLHVFNLKRAFRYTFNTESSGQGEVSSFGALCTALSATIGTGNIVGVATAISLGGPGALFWMEVAAFFGMATKYAEGLLAVKYRSIDSEGRVLGGPFYYIEKGLGPKAKALAIIFAVLGILCGIMGIGTITQIQGITSAVQRFFEPNFDPNNLSTGLRIFSGDFTYSYSLVISGAIVTALVALVVIGGLKRIAMVSTIVVPFMAIFYVLISVLLIFGNLSKIPAAFELIVKAAFDPAAFAGGITGSIFVAMQKGIARGIFSNEAGLGSAPIAAAAAKTNEPARQGLVCMTGTFIDTIIICSMTGLAIVLTGAWEPSLGLKGVDITIEAFRRGLSFIPNSEVIAPCMLMVSLAFFAFTTILGWNYYSEKCLEYLVGTKRRKSVLAYRILYVIAVFVGPYLTVDIVWNTADVFNGLMAFPNLIALLLLSPVVVKETNSFFARLKKKNHDLGLEQ